MAKELLLKKCQLSIHKSMETNIVCAICTPSRGLIFSRTVESIVAGMKALNDLGHKTMFITSHDLKIPDGHNYCVEQALANPEVDRILIFEEDMYMYPNDFVTLALDEHPIATVQYNDRNGSPLGIIHKNVLGRILWCGVGATQIKREVFEKVGIPYFRTDTRYKIVKKRINGVKVVAEFEEIPTKCEYQYGGLDVDFFTRTYKLKYSIYQIPNIKAHHLELVKLGESYTNNGCHIIKEV